MSQLSLGFQALYMCSNSVNALEPAVHWTTAMRSVRLIRHANQVQYMEPQEGHTAGNLVKQGFDPRIFQPVASRYTDWAIPAHSSSASQEINRMLWKATFLYSVHKSLIFVYIQP